MYQVAVLEAGSAAALAKWMEAHDYKYPHGMDQTCEDYIGEGWCFVAVKTRIEIKSLVDARPGMRSVPPPKRTQFDGFIQAMSFRFRVDEPVLPMRLSVFNEGSKEDLVYALTPDPVRFADLPKHFVTRQVGGRRLRQTLTEPLELRVLGGSESAIPKSWRRGIERRRNPEPLIARAKRLIASDLLAVERGELELFHETWEKRFRRSGERRGLEGEALEAYVDERIGAKRDKALDGALRGLRSMTLTVMRGVLPADFLAARNLEFESYRMPRVGEKPKRVGFDSIAPWFPATGLGWSVAISSALLSAAYVWLRRSREGRGESYSTRCSGLGRS